ncbi:YjcZ family sporulation protein [Paenibacillus sp. LHD-117]|nr:YjcZ family sporulation protein [Paenibacillus sp. LHD-117]MDQ6423314.1 YjcZ family sporulation protein [Paenibacillus sp. LHD-117]
MSGVHGGYSSAGVILVLFILLVVITKTFWY